LNGANVLNLHCGADEEKKYIPQDSLSAGGETIEK